MKKNNSASLAIQYGNGKQAFHENISLDKIEKLIKKHSPDHLEKFLSINKRIDAIHKELVNDPDLISEYTLLKYKQAHTDLAVNEDLDNYSNKEKIARIDDYHKYTELGSMLLFEHNNYKGKAKYVTVTFPNLKWWPYKFNDKASSVYVWGLGVLFEHSWYRGRRIYFLGLPFGKFPALSAWNFNDKASSYIG